MPWPRASRAHLAMDETSQLGIAGTPRKAPRRSTSPLANSQLPTWPSDVRRTRSQARKTDRHAIGPAQVPAVRDRTRRTAMTRLQVSDMLAGDADVIGSPFRPLSAGRYRRQVLRVVISRRWLTMLAIAALFAVACVFLGRWQWHRHEAKVARAERIDGHYSASPVPSLGRHMSNGQLASINLAEAQAQTGTPLYGAYLIRRAEAGPPGEHIEYPQALEKPDTDLGPHLAYALQWWLAAPVGFVLVMAGVRREHLERDDLPPVPGQPAAPARAPKVKKIRIWDEEDE